MLFSSSCRCDVSVLQLKYFKCTNIYSTVSNTNLTYYKVFKKKTIDQLLQNVYNAFPNHKCLTLTRISFCTYTEFIFRHVAISGKHLCMLLVIIRKIHTLILLMANFNVCMLYVHAQMYLFITIVIIFLFKQVPL